VAERLMATVARINAERRQTMVMVTHRLAEARHTSGHTVMLEAGRVVEAGATARLFERPAHARTRAYLLGAGAES
jgi:D-methionine transport system ATP-binding protein